MLSRSMLKVMARVALAAILFTQSALVLAACESTWRTPARALALVKQPIEAGPCHQQTINVNLCLAHCLGDDQSFDKPVVKLPVACAATVFFVPMAPDTRPQARASRDLDARHATGPPLRILFQSFLI